MLEKKRSGISHNSEPMVSVLIVADHDTDRHAELADLRSCLQALATQDVDEPVEFLLVETEEGARKLPADLLAELPGLKVIGVPNDATYEQKNAGAQAAQGEIIALLDADCIPVPGWLKSLITTFRVHPEYVAVSGRTMYEGKTSTERCLSVLSRGFLDPGKEGPTRFISNNNSGFLRKVYERFPLPEKEGPYAAQLQSAAIRRDGGHFLFQPAMTVIHDFEGWSMERDIRCHIGWATIRIRQVDPGLRFSWLLRLGQASIPLFYIGRVIESLGTCFRVGRQYGLRLTDYPVALLLTFWIHFLEIKGMLLAFRHQRVDQTKYR
ncbi:MAG: glycosyltransferase family 2 protein [Nitrospira sp.]|nr:glycosyltransferase family 2 protein [Nitrospira sp.]